MTAVQVNNNSKYIGHLEKLRHIACEFAYAGNRQAAFRAATTIRKLGERLKDGSMLALSDWTHGNVYVILGEGAESLFFYQSAEQYYLKVNDALNLARMRVGMVAVLNYMGHYEQACRLAEASWSVLEKSALALDRQRLAGLANNWAIACEYLGYYEKALELYDRKIEFWESWRDKPQSVIEIARTHLNLGILKKRLNLLIDAENDFEASRRILADTAVYRLDLARVEMHLAHLKIRQGAPAEEIKGAFRRARDVLMGVPERLLSLDLFEAEWQFQMESQSAVFLNWLMTLRGQCVQDGSSREAVRVDLLIAGCLAQQGNLEMAVFLYHLAHQQAQTLNDFELVYFAQHGLGRIFAQMQNFSLAQKAFETAVSVVEHIKKEIVSAEIRPFFLEDKLAAYYELATLHIQQNQIPKAFHWIERARAQEMVEMLSQHQSAVVLAKGVSQAISLEQTCQALPQDTLMLVYMLREKVGWILPLTKNGFLAPRLLNFSLPLETIEQSLSWLYNLSQYPPQLIERRAEMLSFAAKQPLQEWYTLCLSPVQELLEKYPKLIISPDGPLVHIPFHALYNGETSCYLIETHEVSQTPSATAWLLGKNQQPAPQKGVLIGYTDDCLPHTLTEVNAIASAHPNFQVYRADEATTDLLHSEEICQAAVIHVASHAVFRGDNPFFSYVNLANGRLRMSDILLLKLKARLVVLSACETGRGFLQGGEYLGLARSFLLAGAQSIIASYWVVDDMVTAELMSNFYQGLADGLSPCAALRQAQLTFLSSPIPRLHHPYYWAPFFLLGTENIQNGHSNDH